VTPQEENGSGSMICAGGVRWMRSQLSMGVALLGEQGCSKFTPSLHQGIPSRAAAFRTRIKVGIDQRIGGAKSTSVQISSQRSTRTALEEDTG